MADCFIIRKSFNQVSESIEPLVLYSYGVISPKLAGFVQNETFTGTLIQNNTDKFTFHKSYSIDGNGYDSGIFRTELKIDFSKYKELVITYGLYNNGAGVTSAGYLKIGNQVLSPETNINYDWSEWTSLNSNNSSSIQKYETIIPISEINDYYYIYFGLYHGTESSMYNAIMDIYEIKLR